MRGIHRLLSRLGQTALYALVATLLAAIVIDQVESPADGFDDFGDALWWSIVTITSVGYGDLVPETTTGRITASLLMVAGLAFLGAIAATLASFLGLADASQSTEPPDVQPVAAESDPAATDRQVGELAELRREITRLAALIDDRHPPDETSGRRS
jgi:voltage-gated potassium channel